MNKFAANKRMKQLQNNNRDHVHKAVGYWQLYLKQYGINDLLNLTVFIDND